MSLVRFIIAATLIEPVLISIVNLVFEESHRPNSFAVVYLHIDCAITLLLLLSVQYFQLAK